MRDKAITYLPKSLADVVVSFESKYFNKTDIANSMKFQDCYQCRRANSHVCRDCQNAKHFLSNDTRKFYYINIEDTPHQGPVEAFLLPYKDVQIDSYVWTKGMKQWDFAGNVLDRRTLAVNFDYCPYCNGTFEREDYLPGYEPVYKCLHCGFEFTYGGTRPHSKSQSEYLRTYCNYMNSKYASEERNVLMENDKHKYSAKLYGPPSPRINDTPVPSSKYKRTKINVDESMRSTIYGTPAITPRGMYNSPTVKSRSVVYGPPPIYRRSCMGYALLIIIILLVLVFLVISYFIY